ncbi:hypothetical protein ATK30_4799 [Amycolatopsis echigonensis]|uniref:Uncharacterized protein n=1 Tax=Amycolatopsis echigonensis TaxID=2576905 RepID=A0A2N3WJ93_9PSEU|nr:hypothetical protein [Amycolatopsis niigatensis]PKV93939.1 hypothetical protein ATK30_4799 [Amycolatopsis niigatensis]
MPKTRLFVVARLDSRVFLVRESWGFTTDSHCGRENGMHTVFTARDGLSTFDPYGPKRGL